MLRRLKQRFPKREQGDFGKSRDSETKNPQHAFCVCVPTVVLPTIRAKNRCLRLLTFQRAGPVVLPGSLVISFIAIQWENTSMDKFIAALIGSSLMLLLSAIARAGSATWDLHPGSGDWNTAGNWTPPTVPNASTDTATFGLSNTPNVSISANTEVNDIAFTSAATNPYIITASSSF